MSNYKAAYTYIEYSLYVSLLFLWEGAEERDRLFHCLFPAAVNKHLSTQSWGSFEMFCSLRVQVNMRFWSRAPPRVNTVLHHKCRIHGHFRIWKWTRKVLCCVPCALCHIWKTILSCYHCPSNLFLSSFCIVFFFYTTSYMSSPSDVYLYHDLQNSLIFRKK